MDIQYYCSNENNKKKKKKKRQSNLSHFLFAKSLKLVHQRTHNHFFPVYCFNDTAAQPFLWSIWIIMKIRTQAYAVVRYLPREKEIENQQQQWANSFCFDEFHRILFSLDILLFSWLCNDVKLKCDTRWRFGVRAVTPPQRRIA